MSLDPIKNLQNIMTQIAEQVLGLHGNPILARTPFNFETHWLRRGMLFRGSIDLELPYEHKLHDQSPRLIRNYEIIVTDHHNVFVKWNEGFPPPSVQSPSPEGFENTSNHDSCWRSDGFSSLFQNYINMADKINEWLEEQGEEQIAPNDMHLDTRFGGWLGMAPLLFVELEIKHPEGENYFFDLKSVKIRRVQMDFIQETENDSSHQHSQS